MPRAKLATGLLMLAVITSRPAAADEQTIVIGPCVVDYREAPDMVATAQRVAETCYRSAAVLESAFGVPNGVQRPYLLKFQRQDPPGYADRGRVYLSIGYLRQRPDDMDFIPHELSHVLQAYGTYEPRWITEGMADYGRWRAGFGTLDCTADYPHYLTGYRCGGTLIRFIERRFNRGIVRAINSKMREGRLVETKFFRAYTGRTPAQLWWRCVEVGECARRDPVAASREPGVAVVRRSSSRTSPSAGESH